MRITGNANVPYQGADLRNRIHHHVRAVKPTESIADLSGIISPDSMVVRPDSVHDSVILNLYQCIVHNRLKASKACGVSILC